MVSDPMSAAGSLFLPKIMSLCSSYLGYNNYKIRETDVGFRAEIVRRNIMIINHLAAFEQRCLRQKQVENIVVIQRLRDVLNAFNEDVNFGVSVTNNSNSAGKKISKKQRNGLIEHDHKVLQRQIKATNIINEIQHIADETSENTTKLLSLEQEITGIRNQFSERNNYIKSI